jgi:hypothetical protein
MNSCTVSHTVRKPLGKRGKRFKNEDITLRIGEDLHKSSFFICLFLRSVKRLAENINHDEHNSVLCLCLSVTWILHVCQLLRLTYSSQVGNIARHQPQTLQLQQLGIR